MNGNKEKVLVAMSGGVDSSVAALILVQQGYDVAGAFMKNWTGNCDWKAERRDALRVAAKLGILLHTFDFEDEYRLRVYDYMIREYELGRTPNPDVMCNREVKFDMLLKAADELGCAYLATGHYARTLTVASSPQRGEVPSRARRRGVAIGLLKGVDDSKDQSYFLCRLGQKELSRAMFPVGGMKKSEVRAMAAEADLPTAEKKDSQGLCFVGKVDFPIFLKERLKPKRGNIVTTAGNIVGEHDGVWFYTIGQREGLGIGGGVPMYIVERRIDTNELIVAVGDDDPALFSSSITVSDVHWVSGVSPSFPFSCSAKIRYRHPDASCVVSGEGKNVIVHFNNPQRAVAPGQFIVFYAGDELMGSGVIEKEETPI